MGWEGWEEGEGRERRGVGGGGEGGEMRTFTFRDSAPAFGYWCWGSVLVFGFLVFALKLGIYHTYFLFFSFSS